MLIVLRYSVKHPGENIKKSTSIHACVLAPDQCHLHSFPDAVPVYDPKTTAVLYPTDV
jgi:hypothetical protein